MLSTEFTGCFCCAPLAVVSECSSSSFIPSRYANVRHQTRSGAVITYHTQPGYTFADDTDHRTIVCNEGSWNTNWNIVGKWLSAGTPRSDGVLCAECYVGCLPGHAKSFACEHYDGIRHEHTQLCFTACRLSMDSALSFNPWAFACKTE